MKDLIRLTDLSRDDIQEIFETADHLCIEKSNLLGGKSIVLFFPAASIRTRMTFEKGIADLGGQSVLFPTEALDKKEDLKNVCGYLENWADAIIVRHRDIGKIDEMAGNLSIPVINAMTDDNHPCEILSDLYALSKCRKDMSKDRYLFCGACGNIGFAWKEASRVLGFELTQCCPAGYEMSGVTVSHSLQEAIKGKDIICTDSVAPQELADFRDYQITSEVMREANPGALLNPCPPFYRGEEVSAEVIESDYFVGYEFKKHLLEIQQAVLLHCLTFCGCKKQTKGGVDT